MQSVYVFVLVAIIATIRNSDSLKCHLCLGSLSSDCANTDPESKAIQICQSENDIEKYVWLAAKINNETLESDKKLISKCIRLSMGDSKYMSTNFERGCGYIYEDVDICEYIRKVVPSIKECKACNTDLCNLT